MKSLIKRILLQIKNDKRLMALILVAPLLILTLVYLLLGNQEQTPVIAMDTKNPILKILAESVREEDAKIVSYDLDTVTDALKNKEYDAAVIIEDGHITLRMLEANGVMTAAVNKTLQNAMASVEGTSANQIKIEYIYGKADASMFETMGYIMLAIISFFFIFILSGIAFIRERTQGTLERFILSPIKRSQIIAGYTLAYGLLATLQSIIIVLYANYVLDMGIGKAIPIVMFIMVMMSMAAVSIGFLVSVISNNEFQVVQFIPIILIPQIFFSGIIPLDSIPFGLGNLAYIMPLYYACDALKHIIIYGDGIINILPDMGVLIGLILVLSVINTAILKQFRKI